MKNICIGIEGLVGSGKTTICRELLNVIPNSILLNGGNLYRAIVFVLMQNNMDLSKLKNADIKSIMDILQIRMEIENRETVFYYKNQKLEEEDLQSEKASLNVSKAGMIANNENLFVFARQIIDKLKLTNTVIISGRGIMKIYKDIDYHFFVTASLDERVRRKCKQYNTDNFEEIKRNIVERDELQRKAGFYDYSDKTIEIDVTNCKDAKEAISLMLAYIK